MGFIIPDTQEMKGLVEYTKKSYQSKRKAWIQTRMYIWPRNIPKMFNSIYDLEGNMTQGHNEVPFYTYSTGKIKRDVHVKC